MGTRRASAPHLRGRTVEAGAGAAAVVSRAGIYCPADRPFRGCFCSPPALEVSDRFDALATRFENEVSGAAGGPAQAALNRITYSSSLADAALDADLVIEAIPEILELKRKVFKQLGQVAPERTIFAYRAAVGREAAQGGGDRSAGDVELEVRRQLYGERPDAQTVPPASAQPKRKAPPRSTGGRGIIARPVHVQP
jgi:hypothetical protein